MGHIWYQHPLFRHSVFPLMVYLVRIVTLVAIILSSMELLRFLGK